MRNAYDRLIGPVALRDRAPDRSLTTLGAASTTSFVPVKFERWSVVAGRGVTGELQRKLAEHAKATDDEVVHLAARYGLPGCSAPVVDATRARDLMQAVRDGLSGQHETPLRNPLVIYAEGEDPRPLWKTHVDPEMFTRERSDELVDAITWCLRMLTRRDGSAEWNERARAVARKWTPSDGASRLSRLCVSAAHRAPALADAEWLPIFAYTLVRASTKVRDARVVWHALVASGPLLLAMIEAGGSDVELIPALALFAESPTRWKSLTVEAQRWMTTFDELSAVEQELALRRRRSPRELDELVGGLRRAVKALRDALRSSSDDLYHRLHHLEADDTEGIRSVLEGVLEERLRASGVGPDTPPGTPIGLETAMILSVRAAFARGRCIECGGRTTGRRARCRKHQRAIWRERKRKQRQGAAVSRRPTR